MFLYLLQYQNTDLEKTLLLGFSCYNALDITWHIHKCNLSLYNLKTVLHSIDAAGSALTSCHDSNLSLF